MLENNGQGCSSYVIFLHRFTTAEFDSFSLPSLIHNTLKHYTIQIISGKTGDIFAGVSAVVFIVWS
jgi:hypothetical protein